MLTAKQKQTYDAIKAYMSEHQIAPTETELATMIGIKSRGVVHRYLTALKEKGLIRLIPNRRRNIELLRPYEDHVLPITGEIAAGRPIEAISHLQSLNISETLLGPGRFILRVKGNSMIGDNICDGDLIVCERVVEMNHNDIAICLVDNDEVTLKRCRENEDGTITLLASNPELSPMVYDSERITVQGIYVGLIRTP